MSEITEWDAQQAPKKSTLRMGLTIAGMLLRNPGALKKVMVMGPDEERYVRPPRSYEIPPFRAGMKHCVSNERYLRPTRWCDPREPLVIAMANELGAYELSDWEFAEAAYWWVKTNIAAEMVPIDSVSATLKRGTGTCMHMTSLWVALCRAGGIKARYKEFEHRLDDIAMHLGVADMMDLGEKERAMLPELLNTGIPHTEGEARIDGRWIVADVGVRPELHAQSGAPVPKFGEDSIGLALELIPGTIKHSESLPLMQGITMRLQSWVAPVVMERASIVLSAPLGKKTIDEAGGIEAYDRKARSRKALFAPEEISDDITRLTKDAERKQAVVFEEE